MKATDIKRDIEQLSLRERASLARWIIINLGEAEDGENVDIAWRREVRTRIDELKSGKVKMIPSDEMWKDLLNNYAKTS